MNYNASNPRKWGHAKMARGPKTRFLDHAIKNGLDSAVRAFPDAFKSDELAALRTLERPLRERLEELHRYWQEFDDKHDD